MPKGQVIAHRVGTFFSFYHKLTSAENHREVQSRHF